METQLITAAFPDLEAAGIEWLPEEGIYSMESDSKKGEFYDLEPDADENGEVFYTCTCRAALFGKQCKHVKRLTALLTRDHSSAARSD